MSPACSAPDSEMAPARRLMVMALGESGGVTSAKMSCCGVCGVRVASCRVGIGSMMSGSFEQIISRLLMCFNRELDA